jgi:DNA-binding GntR family transcriptional regulator
VAALREAYEDLRAAYAESVAARIDTELRCHQTICALSGNELLLQLWQELRPVIQLMLHCVPVSATRPARVHPPVEASVQATRCAVAPPRS